MTVVYRTAAAADVLRTLKAQRPQLLIGAGTVTNPDQARAAKECGAEFAVAPGFNPKVVAAAQEVGLPFAPGIMTPSDIEQAIGLGCRELKFFPAASSGGLPHLQSIAAPYRHLGIRFIPLGGINPQNLGTYLADPLIMAVGGSWLAPREHIEAGEWQRIRQRAEEARLLAQQVGRNRSPGSGK